MCERFESRSQYVLDALRTVPFVIASQVRRTFDIAVFLSEASALYIGLAAASLAGGPGFLYDHSAFLPIALDSPAGLEAEGLPYVIDSWESMTGPARWQKRQNEMPLQNERVRFAEK